jgi:cytochrome P450
MATRAIARRDGHHRPDREARAGRVPLLAGRSGEGSPVTDATQHEDGRAIQAATATPTGPEVTRDRAAAAAAGSRPAAMLRLPSPSGPPLPPGPRGRWPVGNGLALRRDQLGFFTRMQRQYGNAVSIGLGRVGNLYLYSAPEAVERILVTNASNYTSREVNQPSMPFLGDGLLNIDGEFHRSQRALVQPSFSRRRVESYAPVMLRYTEDLLARWRIDQVVDMRAEMQRLTLQIVARALFGLDLAGESESLGEAFNRVIGYDEGAGPLPRIRLNLPFTAYGRFVRAERVLDREVVALVAARRQAAGAEASGAGDVVTTLLQAQAGDGGGLSDRLVRDHAMTLLAAGHETTSNLLTFTFYLLSRHPGERSRLRAELRRVLGGRTPTVEDLPHLPRLDLVIKESLRLYPPAWVIGRRARADDTLVGYLLPAGSFALISQWVVHRVPELWPNPDQFLPDRFLPPAEGGQTIHPFAYFPFGGGLRTCIGMPFAQQEAKLILASILQRFEPELLPGQRLVLEPRVTLRPARGTRMRLRPAT